ncbi:MAG: mannitol-1-phosphate 5-dehydrogenase [Candidatus Hydrogenedentes bacterium]|nr:mannitol-1-phosphate 5-dehydrogenase [Candidatus Hydrogenedentota bacterium]
MSKLAVQIGAGNIGRGFLGQLYFESGYHTVFVDVVQEFVEGLNSRGEYPLRILSEDRIDIQVGNVSAVHASELDAVADVIARADICSTAVGVSILPKIAPLLARGIAKRFATTPYAPLNIIVCENMVHAGSYLHDQVRGHLPEAFHAALDEHVGFVEASIGRMVPVMTEKEHTEDPLLVCVEPYCDLPVDKAAFKGGIPDIKHMHPRDNFGGYVERKLFIHNLSHAATAYLGYLRGHEYIWQAIQDDAVRPRVEAAMAESRDGLRRKWGLDAAELKAHCDDLIYRYQNKALGDQVARVAKDPVRKLGANDRLIGAANMCLSQGVEPVNVAFAAAAAIRYDHPDDPAAAHVQSLFQEEGMASVLTSVCQVGPESPLAYLIFAGNQRLEDEGWLKQGQANAGS